jgi:hypothetical protein
MTETTALPTTKSEGCSVFECEAKYFAKGMCEPHYMKAYRKANKARIDEQQRVNRQANQDKINARNRARRATDPEMRERERLRRAERAHEHRKYTVQYLYGITWDEYLALYEAQDGKCAICNVPIVPKGMGAGLVAHVDHDHKTGAVRGLLCPPHNTGLGYYKDSPTLLRAAAEYLDKYAAKV